MKTMFDWQHVGWFGTVSGVAAACAVFMLAMGSLQAQPSELAGAWSGYIQVMGLDVDVTMRFERVDDQMTVQVEFPSQGATLPADEVVALETGVTVQVNLPTGPIVFEGAMTEAGTLDGTFTQSGHTGTFSLSPGELSDVGGPPIREPEPAPTDYRAEEVTFSHGDITLAGTLSMPLEGSDFPAVVLISGSGAQTRDEDVYGFLIFRTLAEHLTRSGVAVLRYDDRGTGGSSPGSATDTTRNFADDTTAAVNYLLTRAEIDATRIGVLGHSEGGIIAAMVGSEVEGVAFVILMAGPSVSGYEIRLSQMRAELRIQGLPEEEWETHLDAQRRIMDAALAGEDLSPFVDELLVALPGFAAMSEEEQALAHEQALAQLNMVAIPWFLHFMSYDPGPALAAVTVPVLAVFGAKDVQVPPDDLAPVMIEVLSGNPNASVEVIPEANHLFQVANTGHYNEYASLEHEFAPAFLETVTGWILTVTAAP